MRTAGCATMTSCNAGCAKSALRFAESIGCANERSCNATRLRRLRLRDRHAFTRPTFTEPRKIVPVLRSNEPAGLAGGLCLPRDRSAPHSISGDADYVGQGEITCDSTCICDVPYRPSRPLLRGHMISQCRARIGSRNQNRRQTSRAISQRQIHRLGVRRKYRLKPSTFVENQTGAENQSACLRQSRQLPRN